MKHTTTVTETIFDNVFFVEGDCYRIRDMLTNLTHNFILHTHASVFLEFIDMDGCILTMNIDDYLTRYDVVKMYPDEGIKEITVPISEIGNNEEE